MKRVFDLLFASLLLFLFAPILVLVSILIKTESSGPIVYLSPRMGKDGKQIGLARFRTMDQIYDPTSADVENRVTRVGGMIRNYSLDDLPNLLNVLIGDMSFVGPRPTEPHLVDLTNPEWQRILSVRPGMFSYAIWALAQEFNTSDQALRRKLELHYVQNQSLWFDLKVLGQWIQKLAVSRGNVKARGNSSLKD